MLDWFFKRPPPLGSKPAAPAAPRPAPAPAAAAPAPQPAKKAAPKPKPAEIDWQPQLQAAAGNDERLLALAVSNLPLAAKLAAVQALDSEAALKQAEKHFRNHDRRVHQLAKTRLGGRVAERETRARADELVAEAQALLQDPLLPANRLVELDRAWQKLDLQWLQPAVRDGFAGLMAQLTAQSRARSDRELQAKRWVAEARETAAALQASCGLCARGEQDRAELAAATARAQAVHDAAPPAEAPGLAAGAAALAQALQAAQELDQRLALLEALQAAPADTAPRAPRPARTRSAQADAAGDATADSPAAGAEKPAAAEAGTESASREPAGAGAEDAAGTSVHASADDQAEPAASAASSTVPAAGPETAAAEATDAAPHADGPASTGAVGEPAGEAAAHPAAAEAAADASADAAEAPSAVASPAAAPAEAPQQPSAAHPGSRQALVQQWQALPPLADAAQAQALAQRFEAWQQAKEQQRQQRRQQQRDQAKDQQRAERSRQQGTLAGLLDAAEAALDGGHLQDTHKHLVAIDELLHGGAPVEGHRGRLDQLQARYAQLKGWQHWAGGRARDELTLQAEALAATVAGPPEARTVKIPLQKQAELIDEMRARWKELDRLGGATSRALWQRFDTALKAAWEPIAARDAAVRAARDTNLAARRQLIDGLAALRLPGEEGADAPPEAPWRPLADALAHFHTEWRKLGPVEHTVPRKAQPGLQAQLEQALQRVEAPLQQARAAAQGAREQLLARARALAEQAAAGGPIRDLGPQVRELQATWQQQAKALPLQRGVESALWNDFKGALDSIFSARDAAFNAREAEFKAHGAQRQALIEQLEALTEDTPAAELRRKLAEADAAWQRCGPAPRADAAALDQRWRHARDTAQRWLDQSAQRRWQGVCDVLQAKLALCEGGAPGADAGQDTAADAGGVSDIVTRWQALPALPPTWEQALRQRAGLAGGAAPRGAAHTDADALMLQLEAAWDVPSPPAHQAARTQLKLQALKSALESRRGSSGPASPDELLAALLQQAGLGEEQLARRSALLQALRRRGRV